MYDFDEAAERIAEKARKWDRKIIEQEFGRVPDDFIPMWIADMDFKMSPEIARAFQSAIARGGLGYTYCYDEFYQAVMRWQKEMHCVDVEQEWITLSYGTVSTIHYLLQAFCTAGESVLMNTPVYAPFDDAAAKQGVRRIYNRLAVKNGRYFLDFDALEAQLKKERPRLFLFCSPHNPGGRIWSLAELSAVASLCRETDTILVADEVHCEHIHYGSFHSALKIGAEYEKLIILASPNKGFNLGGLKTSYSIIPNVALRLKFKERLAQNSVTSPNVFGVIGLIAAYEESRAWLTEVSRYIRGNYEWFAGYVERNIPQLQIMKMEASYLLWLNIEATGLSSAEMTRLLATQAGVLVEDGRHFVQDGEGYIRLNLGTQRRRVCEAAKRMDALLKAKLLAAEDGR